MTNEFAAPVTPSNTPRGSRRRRDPDDTPAAAQTTTVEAPTTAPPPPGPPPAAVQPSTGLAAHTPTTGGTLDHVLTTPTSGAQPGTNTPATDSVHVLAGLARMRLTPVDPHKDYVSDSTRQLRWVAMAIAQIANLTGRTRQDIVTRALLGIEPLPADVLDANWLAVYGYPRDQYRPQQ